MSLLKRASAAVTIAAAGILTLSACAGGPVTKPISELTAGECFTPDADGAVAIVVPCGEPHLYEVTGRASQTDLYAPPVDDPTASTTTPEQYCAQAFAEYTGRAPETDMEFAPGLFATERERTVCVLSAQDGSQVTDSQRA